MRIPPQAQLESAILLVLRDHPATTVTALAARAGASRPSTSRALASLAKKGLVASRGRSRSLTDEGRTAADDLLNPGAALVRAVEADRARMKALVDRVALGPLPSNTMLDTINVLAPALKIHDDFSEGIAKAFDIAHVSDIVSRAASAFGDLAPLDITKSIATAELAALAPIVGKNLLGDNLANVGLGPDVLPNATMLETASLIAVEGPRFSNAVASFARSIEGRDIAEALSGATALGRSIAAVHALPSGLGAAAAMDSIRVQVDALAPAMVASADWLPVLTEGVSIAARIFDDRLAIDALSVGADRATKRLFERVAGAVDPVMIAQRDITAAAISQIADVRAKDAVVGVLGPATTTRELTGAGRALLERESRSADQLPSAGDLFDILEEHGMKTVVVDLLGARSGIANCPPGWVKAVSNHLREAFREVLLVLAPDEELPRRTGEQVTRKMRIHYALRSDSGIIREYATSTADAWDSMIKLLNAEAHNSDDPRIQRGAGVGVLLTLEGLIRFIVDVHDRYVETNEKRLN